MPPMGSSTISFPSFTGATRRLVIANIVGYFLVLLGQFVRPLLIAQSYLVLVPEAAVRHGFLWQLATYSFINVGLLSTALNLLSLWFIGSYLETAKGSRWLYEAYLLSVIGGGAIGSALSFTGLLRLSPRDVVFGPSAAIFGLLVAFGVFFGDQEFYMLVVSIKAKYLVAIYLLIAIASLIGGVSPLTYAVYLSGGLLGYLYAKFAPGRGLTFSMTERYFGLRNNYYRWKRRRAARKFEVYMGKRGRAVHFDKEGRFIDPDSQKGPRDPNDRRWMN
jgi:membrane associated rhomboid family serine protease